MIFLADQKLLFVKPRKTGGTSVELALSANAGAQDIVTPLAFEAEVTRLAIGGHIPCNWAWLPWFERRFAIRLEEALARGSPGRRMFKDKPRRLAPKYQARYFNHITPRGIAARGGSDLLRTARMVTIARHPYELMVSYASHIASGGKSASPDLSRFIDEALDRPALDQEYLFGPTRPDIVLRHERLLEDLAALETEFGLDLVARLPRAKSGIRRDHRPAAEILTEAQRQKCQRVYARTFEEFDYQR